MDLEAEIRRLLQEGGHTQRQIARSLGTSAAKVNRVAKQLKQDSETNTETVKQSETKRVKHETRNKHKSKNSKDKVTGSRSETSLIPSSLSETVSEPRRYANLTGEEKDQVQTLVAILLARGYSEERTANYILRTYKIAVSAATVHNIKQSKDIQALRQESINLVLGGVPDAPISSNGVRMEALQAQLDRFQEKLQLAVDRQTEIKNRLKPIKVRFLELWEDYEKFRTTGSHEHIRDIELFKLEIKDLNEERKTLEKELYLAEKQEITIFREMQKLIENADKNMTNWLMVQLKKQEVDARLAELRQDEEEAPEDRWVIIEGRYKEIQEEEMHKTKLKTLICDKDYKDG